MINQKIVNALPNNDCYKVAIIIWQCVFLFLIFVGLQTLVSLI
ncbi:hypothetical protein BACCELL_05514 [Bacteroides cellulosilyticus DSM 14838]|uniref:Uncharacterized protein n=1 Tax=Bacteroides cellulosilyticus DSM 14838 TaxID=537012 RepID=E2NMG9_9BACE|nr:hypothetical protein BACCELL_05514 [Bacteroides cellulosilyticus DSM 14838]